ncbi:hypothetical protein [Sphingomonas oryzagri]
MRPFERPSGPRRPGVTVRAIIATLLLSLAWLGLYALTRTHWISEQGLWLLLFFVVPVAVFALVPVRPQVRREPARKRRRQWKGQEIPPPVDIAALWAAAHPLDPKARHGGTSSAPPSGNDT